jgi:hypothetical protein
VKEVYGILMEPGLVVGDTGGDIGEVVPTESAVGACKGRDKTGERSLVVVVLSGA